MIGISGFMLSDKAFGRVKHLVQVVLPASGALYFGLASIWNLPASEEVVGSIAIITTFLGVSLGISSKSYDASDKPYVGNILVNNPIDGPKTYSLDLNQDPEEIDAMNSVKFRVITSADPIGEDEV